MTIPVAVFASGGGSNFQSLLDHNSPANPGRIDLLISDRPSAGALERAKRAGVATRVIPVAGRFAVARVEAIEPGSGARPFSEVAEDVFKEYSNLRADSLLSTYIEERRSITDIDSGESVGIPSKDISDPVFHHGQGGRHEGVHPGNREFVTGDKFKRPPGGGAGEGEGVWAEVLRDAAAGRTLARDQAVAVVLELEQPAGTRKRRLGDGCQHQLDVLAAQLPPGRTEILQRGLDLLTGELALAFPVRSVGSGHRFAVQVIAGLSSADGARSLMTSLLTSPKLRKQREGYLDGNQAAVVSLRCTTVDGQFQNQLLLDIEGLV